MADLSSFDCAYCGMPATDRDHVIPRSYTGDGAFSRKVCVPACKECNNLLSNLMFTTVAKRAAYIAEALRERHSKLLALPEWSEGDYEGLTGRLLGHVKSSLRKKRLVQARIDYAEYISKLDELGIEAVWEVQTSA